MKTTPKKNGGFTLVELIVVIAILAILAAVAIPAYSGYIEKAEKANDLQLLGAVNQAFGAACVENNIFDMTTVEGTVISLDSNGYIVGMNVKESLSNAPTIDTTGNPVLASFIRYYGDNINTPFKYFHTKLVYGPDGFDGLEPGEKDTGLYGDIFEDIAESIANSVADVKGSVFGEIGAEELMNKVTNVTELSNKLAMGDGETGPSEAYRGFLANGMVGVMNAFGYDPENMTDAEGEEFEEKWGQLIAEKMEKDGTDETTAMYSLLTNYAVLNAAKNTDSSKSATSLATAVESGTLTSDILKNLMKDKDPTTSSAALGDAAMMYGMYTAWANGLDDDDANKAQALENASTINGFINDMENEAFLNYLKDTEGSAQTDLEGYIAAMDIITQASTDNSDAVADLMINGYEDPALLAALEDLLK